MALTAKEQKELDDLMALKKQAEGSSPNIVEEMSPDISKYERAAIKNLSDESSPDALAWLKSRHPELDIQHSGGRILVRKPGDKSFHVIDPDTGAFSGDILNDLTDAAYPTAAGLAESAAAGAGSLAGGLPGGMAAGAAAGAGTEALKQALARAIGLSKEFSPKDVAINAGVNAAFPAGEKLMKGAYSIGKQKIFPWVGEYTSGVPSDVIKTTMNRLPELDQLEKGSLFDFSQEAKNRVSNRLFDAIDEKGAALAQSLADAGVKVPVGPAVEPLESVIANLKRIQTELPTPAIKAEIAAVDGLINRNFKTSPSKIKATVITPKRGEDVFNPLTMAPEPTYSTVAKVKELKVPATPIQEVSPEIAWELQKRIGTLAQYAKLKPTEQMVSPRYMDDTVRALDDSYWALGDAMSASTGGESQALKNGLKEVYDLKRLLQPHFGTPEATYKTLTNLETKNKAIPKELLDKAKVITGVDIKPEADLLRAQSILGDRRPGGIPMFPMSSQGTTSTTRSGALGLLGGTLGGALGSEIGDGSALGMSVGTGLGAALGTSIGGPRAIKNYIRLMNAAEKKAAVPGVGIVGGMVPRSTWHLIYDGMDQESGQ